MVIRKDSKVDAFQRQISALRHQLGGEQDDLITSDPVGRGSRRTEQQYRTDFAVLGEIGTEFPRSSPDVANSVAVNEPCPLPPTLPTADLLTSVIAHTTTWNGTLESSGSLHVHGRVDGALTARDDVFIAEEAEVDATITAANVTIAGSVRGAIHCAERFEVLPRGRVAGDVFAPVIVVHEGATLAGEISMAKANEARASAGSTRLARGGD